MSSERLAIELNVNGSARAGFAEPRTLLSDFLRHELGFTGVHVGCEHGVCGACTILLDGIPVRSCLMFAVQGKRHTITTIEGLAHGEDLHPVQQAFKRNHGLQCGFCTPGMVLTAVDLLHRESDPSEQRVREGMSGNLCRCTGYQNIIKAVRAAAKEMRK
jgi:aerobic carbon-monoxide dehydrogenase small subunit